MSLRNIEGVVLRTNTRQVNTTRGAATAFSVQMQTSEGEEWFSFGFKDPKVVADQQIRFVAKESNGFWNGDPKTVQVDKSAPTPAAAPSGGMKAAIASADVRQRSIVWQSSYRTAAEIAGYLLASDSVPFPTKAAKNARFDFVMSLIDEIAMNTYSKALSPPEPLVVVDDDEEVEIVDDSADEEYKVL